jgi:GntR family transcriptional regulator/MocR family aminotransferase
VSLTGLAAGFHAVVQLDGSIGEAAIIESAAARSVGLYGMSVCRATHQETPVQLVLGFGNTDERAITSGIAAVGDLLSGDPSGHPDRRPHIITTN